MEVKKKKTLYNSFRDYVAVETPGGENKYDAKGFGLQDARKGITFQSFPPVLHLQLKRFCYDAKLDSMVKVLVTYVPTSCWSESNSTPKINDSFEFPFEIDLDEFLDKTADRTKPWKYELCSVLVHSGDLQSGHNYAFIKPGRSTQWLKFDNDRVTPVTNREVLEENYSGGLNLLGGATPWTKVKMSTNAYVLAYIRKAAIDEVMAPLTEKDVPLHLSELVSGWR